MSDAKKRSPILTGLFLLVLLALAAGVTGYMFPGLPWAPYVQKVFQKGAEGMDKSGVYKVTVKEVVLSPEEFEVNENLDIQVTIERFNLEGKSAMLWESKQYGSRRAKVGQTGLTANWIDRPLEMEWHAGEKIVVKVWDRAGLGSSVVCTWEIEDSKVFPLKGAHTFDKVKGKTPRPGGTNQIVFDSERLRDLS